MRSRRVRMSQSPLGEHWDFVTGRQRAAEQGASSRHTAQLLSSQVPPLQGLAHA